jgi:hypothetical protein
VYRDWGRGETWNLFSVHVRGESHEDLGHQDDGELIYGQPEQEVFSVYFLILRDLRGFFVVIFVASPILKSRSIEFDARRRPVHPNATRGNCRSRIVLTLDR